MQFAIRAEHRDGTCEDFEIGATEIKQARERAEESLRTRYSLPDKTVFDWHGAVVFVGRFVR